MKSVAMRVLAHLPHSSLAYVWILSGIAVMNILLGGFSAYDWPAIDMIPFFRMALEDHLLENDLVSVAMAQSENPRAHFGYFVVMLAKLFGATYYQIIFGLKVFFTIVLTPLYFLFTYHLAASFLPSKPTPVILAVCFIGSVLATIPVVSAIFSIAWWAPFHLQATPQCLATVCALAGCCFLESDTDGRLGYFTGLFLIGSATFFHPAVSIFILTLYLLAKFMSGQTSWLDGISIFFISYMLPALAIWYFYAPGQFVETQEFAQIYAMDGHASHYHLANFGSLTPIGWQYSAMLICSLLFAMAIWFYHLRHVKIFVFMLLCLAAYIGAILGQYIAVDLWPIRPLINLGPVRFTALGYWMLVIGGALIAWTLLPQVSSEPTRPAMPPRSRHLIIGFVLAAMASLTLSPVLIDKPLEDRKAADRAFFEFIDTTDTQSVFAAYFSDYLTAIPNIGDRAIFAGNGFSFNEAFMREWFERRKMVLGDIETVSKLPGGWIGEKHNAFYRQLTPADFVRARQKYGLDYVVVENAYSQAFRAYKPSYQDAAKSVYSVAHFQVTE